MNPCLLIVILAQYLIENDLGGHAEECPTCKDQIETQK
jgi:hypothetical protein